ncbi:hypothetical protein, partial [Vulcanisaeta distributa]|uniref:hypothetical protein n=1 Tax=Vulcanisaeta distributa TaxID=164451 RepID=UPI001FB52DE1
KPAGCRVRVPPVEDGGVDGGVGGCNPPRGFSRGGGARHSQSPQVRVVGGFNGWVPGCGWGGWVVLS